MDITMLVDLVTLPEGCRKAPAYIYVCPTRPVPMEDRAVFEQKVKKAEFKPDKKSIGCELKKGEQIEGAQLKTGDLRLVIE